MDGLIINDERENNVDRQWPKGTICVIRFYRV